MLGWWRRTAQNVPGKSWTVFLMTDAYIVLDHRRDHAMTDRGRRQVSAAVSHLRSMTTVTPAVWLGAPYPMHDLTAEELVRQLGIGVAYEDKSAAINGAFCRGASGRVLYTLLEQHNPAVPVVLVTLYAQCQALIRTTGADVMHSGRFVRSSRVYPISVGGDRIVGATSIFDFSADAPELVTPNPRSDMFARD